MRQSLLIGLLVVLAASDTVQARGRRGRRWCGYTVAWCAPASHQAEVSSAAAADAEFEKQREAALREAINEYRAHRQIDDWRARVGIDRRLLRDAGKMRPERLADILHANPHDLEVATAVAVCLGQGSLEDSPKLVAELLVELLGSPYERVRYRAAESVTQRVQDGTMPEGVAALVLPRIGAAIEKETNRLNAESLRYARRLLQEREDGAAHESP